MMHTRPNVDPITYPYIGIGFGPANLAIAIAGRDRDDAFAATSIYLEQQPSFQWHPGMILPRSKMQVSFLKDFATMREPRSYFTFLNYLHLKDRLVDFINMSTFTPSRIEYQDYMRWCAQHFTNVKYNERAVAVEAVTSRHGGIDRLRVLSTKTVNDHIELNIRTTRNIIIGVGGTPAIPRLFQRLYSSSSNMPIIHTSEYTLKIEQIRNKPQSSLPCKFNIAIIGGGQSAAEIFLDLSQRFPEDNVDMIIRDTAIRPADDTPFVNQVFDPSARDDYYKLSPERRKSFLENNKQTNYGVVRQDLINEIYEIMYLEKILKNGKYRILNDVEIDDVSLTGNKVAIVTKRNGELLEALYDIVILATGYTRNDHLRLIEPIKQYLCHEQCPVSSENQDAALLISRDYRVLSKPNFKPGVYFQGCCEGTHGLNDTLLSVLAVRSSEVLDSLNTKADQPEILKNISAVDSNANLWHPFSSEDGVMTSPTADCWTQLPASGTLLYSVFVPWLENRLTFHVTASCGSDLQFFNTWHNDPRISAFWNEHGSLEEHSKYLANLLSTDSHSMPVIGSWNGKPFGYFEIYWAKRDLVGAYYDFDITDRGFHMLSGEAEFRGPHYVKAWLHGIVEFMFLASPSCHRVVSEPRADNAKMITYLNSVLGMTSIGVVKLPHKEASIMTLERAKFNFGWHGNSRLETDMGQVKLDA